MTLGWTLYTVEMKVPKNAMNLSLVMGVNGKKRCGSTISNWKSFPTPPRPDN